MSHIRLETKGQIAFLTINRPKSLNSFNYEALVELGKKVDILHSTREVRAIIITGEGDKAFSAGADLRERKGLGEAEVRRNVKKIRDVFNSIAQLPQPTIAAVNGYALGGGFELMLACDFKIAAEHAKMGLTEVSWGIIPGAGGTQRLTRLIGEMKAKELIFTARKINAHEAFHCGILTKVVSKNSLIPCCLSLAEEIIQNAPLAVAQAKYAIQYGADHDIQTGLAFEANAYEVIIPTRDRIEALEAFNEKRRPVFIGK